MHDSISCASLAAGLALAFGLGAAPVDAEPLGRVVSVQGVVLVNSGNTFVAALIGTAVVEQDRLFVLEGSSATLAMEQGCTLDLTSNEVVTVTAENVCRPAEIGSDTLTEAARKAGLQDAGAIAKVAVSQADERALAAGATLFGGAGANAVGLVALGVSAAGGLAWAVSNDGPDRRSGLPARQPPISP
jgi:hypothetical protein